MLVATERLTRTCLMLALVLVALAAVAPAARAQDEPPYLYWDNSWAQTLGRGTIDGNAANTNQNLVGHAGGQVDGFPVAADAKYLYWANSVNLTRAGLDGIESPSMLLTLAIGARWMAVDNRFIYLANDSWISRANLDGSGYIEGSSSDTPSSASAWRSTSGTSTG